MGLPPEASATELTKVPAVHVEQDGLLPEGVSAGDGFVLSNEPVRTNASLIISFDFERLPQTETPLARLQLADLTKVKVKRPGQKAGTARGVLHAFARLSDKRDAELVGSAPVKPAGIATPYTLDVTRAVNDALARPAGQRKLRLEVRMTGLPCCYEVYALPQGVTHAPPFMEVAPLAGWTQDWAQRLAPLNRGHSVYREACMPMTTNRSAAVVPPLLYPVQRITEVVHSGTGEKLQEFRDWMLRDGKLVLPPGSHAPIQVEKEFFVKHPKPGEAAMPAAGKPLPLQSIVLMEGTWYHERQIEVTYEPASRDWPYPAPRSSLADLPRLKKLLAAKNPVRVVLFGDSISLGGNASKVQGGWPYQPCFGELVAWQLERQTGSKVTYMNHSRGGAGAAYGASQAESQVGWFKPDLAIIGFGMNDRRPERQKTFRADMEKILDTIRASSPDTEFVIVTPILNNPKQPDKGEAILAIRDETFKISRPGVAFADVTSVEQELVRHKNYLDLSGNGANHPNDFMQRIYAQRILEVLIPAADGK